MIYIQPLRRNDINPSMGKQYEFGKAFFASYGWEGGTTHAIRVNYKTLTIITSIKVRGDERGGDRVGADGKEYAIDGKLPLKNLLINNLGLNVNHVGVVTLIFEAINEKGTEFNLYTVPEKIPSTLPSLNIEGKLENQPLQQIFYGAPGTGKSHTIKDVTDAQPKENVFRTTFHPDSDYSTFVGCYKPTKVKKVVRDMAGKPALNDKKEEIYEDTITYKFVPQAFLKAYIRAYQTTDPVYLIIEEINRGNCAQIFGDLFQLLDRKDGVSEYPIKADNDLAQYLKDEYGEDFAGIADDELCLPANLYIWATMNTSDQSLFPIDSAFKRRWDWKYIRIEDAGMNYKIQVNGHEYDWFKFLTAINKEILTLTHSEDKQLGYFFAKADANGVIDADKLVNKVYFYLWSDVFKDYEVENNKVFKKADSNDTIAFKDFFAAGDKVDEVAAEQILINLKLNEPEAE